MTTANRLIAALNDAKANLLTVSIVEQASGEILATIDTGFQIEEFLADDLDQLVRRLERVTDNYRLM